MQKQTVTHRNELPEAQLAQMVGGIQDLHPVLQQLQLAHLDTQTKMSRSLHALHHECLQPLAAPI